MFEDDDDFEIDEQFLDGVFDAERSATKNDDSLEISLDSPEVSTDSVSSPIKKRRISVSVSPQSYIEKPTAARRTSEETARLVTASKRSCALPIRLEGNDNEADIDLNLEARFKATDRDNADINSNCGFGDKGELFKPPPKPNNNLNLQNYSPVRSPNQGSDVSFTLNTSRVRQRKFPGPAGLLPERGRSHLQGQRSNFSSLLNNSGGDLEEAEEPLSFCSQSTASVLEDGPWGMVQSDLHPEGQGLLKHYTVAWVKQKAAARQLVGQKVPFLAAVLHSIDCSSPDPCIVLRDETGEIPGTLHRSVWDSFGGQLIVGSALVLRLVGVLSTGISARRHYLNITSNNIVTIYSSPLCESSVPASSRVRKTDVHKWTIHQLLQTANSWEDQSKRRREGDTHLRNSHLTSRNLFNPSSNSNSSSNTRPPLQLSNRSMISTNNSSVSSMSTSAHTVFRPPPQPSRSDTSSFNKTSVLHSGIRESNDRLLPVGPQMQTLNRSVVQGATPSFAQNRENTRQQIPNNPHSNVRPEGLGKFVPKKPSFSGGVIHNSNANLPMKSSSVSIPLSSQKTSQLPVASQSSIDLFSDADNFDVSSVLDGIDSESLFGDF